VLLPARTAEAALVEPIAGRFGSGGRVWVALHRKTWNRV